jgi:hypothetical protein
LIPELKAALAARGKGSYPAVGPSKESGQ